MEDVMAETLEGKIDSFERFDRMLASSEARRNNALREIERHRVALGAAVRQAMDEIQDAESVTSRPEKWAEERRLDQRSPTVRQSRQREIEHRA